MYRPFSDVNRQHLHAETLPPSTVNHGFRSGYVHVHAIFWIFYQMDLGR